MKTSKIIFLGIAFSFLFTSSFSQSYVNKASSNTKISQLLYSNNAMVSSKFWDLGTIVGQDKFKVSFQALETGNNKSSDITKGIKVVVFDDNKKSEAQMSSLFYFDKLVTYIDVDEYDDILTSVNYMLNTLNIWSNEKLDHADIFYTTKDNFTFGFEQDGKKQTGYMKISFERVEFSCELKKFEKSLESLKDYIETASKELYIKENRDKFEQAKKEEELRAKEAEQAKKAKEKEAKNKSKEKEKEKKKENTDEDQL